MWPKTNQKTVGAFVIGLSLVAAAYIVSNFNLPGVQKAPLENNSQATVRSAITVTDNDNNGVEDWRDAFVTAEPINLTEVNASYTPPTSITGKLGITFFEDIVRSKNYGPLGRSPEQVISDTVTNLSKDTTQYIHGINDVSVLENFQDVDIKNYGNAMAGVITRNNYQNTENELVILNDIMSRNNTERVAELDVIAGAYKGMRDESLLVPVPRVFLKQHLDLINTYEAMYQDISAMALSVEDPAVALLRIKRYREDALGLGLALQNMYDALEPHAGLFSANDPAVLFANFNSDNVTQQ